MHGYLEDSVTVSLQRVVDYASSALIRARGTLFTAKNNLHTFIVLLLVDFSQ
jgi:hypothetical protein